MKKIIKKFAKDVIPFIARPVLSRIHQFKDIHKGESCYLFGNGISLKYFDFTKFNDKTTIGCTFLPFHKEFDRLKCPYVLFTDSFQFFPLHRVVSESKKFFINKVGSEYMKAIARYKDKKFFLDVTNYPVTWAYKNIIYEFQDIFDPRLADDFISKKFNCFAGSLRAQILLAIYMGFDEALLAGHDYTHHPSRSLHFYEKGTGVRNSLSRWDEEFLSFAKKFIRIKTMTLDGKSETLDYITYKEYTGAEPVFRENNEIVEDRYLKALSTRPGYLIY